MPASDVKLAPTPAESSVNGAYLEKLGHALATIREKYPGIETWDPLPELAGEPGGMCGFAAPFNPATYDNKHSDDAVDFSYSCATDLFWQSVLTSALPFVPISEDRVMDMAVQLQPGLTKFSATLVASFHKLHHASRRDDSAQPR